MQQSGQIVTVKKYSNRRLYDTSDSRYITLDELAQTIRSGKDVRVIDAKSNEDLTQQTLTQIILESRRAARLLPVPLLTQLIRMGDDALAEFFGRYMSWALELYVHAKQGAQAVSPFNPFATMPFAAGNAMARFLGRMADSGGEREPPAPPPVMTREPMEAEDSDPEEAAPANGASGTGAEIERLRRELEELKAAVLAKSRDA